MATSKLADLRQEEKNLRLTLAALKARIEDWDESKELANIRREIRQAKAELDKARAVLSVAKRERAKAVAETRKMLRTLDDKNVYLDEVSPGGRSSILVGRIEGEKFVWHKPYLDTYRGGVVG